MSDDALRRHAARRQRDRDRVLGAFGRLGRLARAL